MNQAEDQLGLLGSLIFCLKFKTFWKSCHLWHVSRSPRALSSNPWFGVKGLGDNIVSSAIFLSSSVLQQIFWKGDSAVHCLPVGSRGEYYWRIFSVSPVILPSSIMTWAGLCLCYFLYLSRVYWVWIFILADVAMGSKWSFSLESTRISHLMDKEILLGEG